MNRIAQIVVGIAAVALTAGCGGEHQAATVTEGPPVAVQAEAVRMAQVPVTVTAVGTTEPYAQATPGTRLMGRVAEVRVDEGDQVSRGAVLVRIEDQDLTAKRQQAQAVLSHAQTTVNRMRNLYEQKAVPKQQLDEAETALAQAQAGLKEVDANLEYSSVASPLDGVVVRKFVQVGNMTAPGAPLFTVEQQDPMKVTVEVAEGDLVYVKVGSPVLVEVEALQAAAGWTGKVEAVLPSADPGSRTFQVKVVVSNPDNAIRSGMFARVGFQKGARPGLLVPSAAVVQEGQLRGVYVVSGDRAQLRWVRLGKIFGERTEVISGLGPGDRVAVSGLDRLTDGSLVEVRDDG